MEIKLCNTLLSWKLNSALLEIRLSSLFHFRSALGPELASNPRACCLSSFASIGLPKRCRCTIVHPSIQHNFLCRSLLQAHITLSLPELFRLASAKAVLCVGLLASRQSLTHLLRSVFLLTGAHCSVFRHRSRKLYRISGRPPTALRLVCWLVSLLAVYGVDPDEWWRGCMTPATRWYPLSIGAPCKLRITRW